MPRKKNPAAETAPSETTSPGIDSTPLANTESASAEPVAPPTAETHLVAEPPVDGPTNPDAKNWGPPYKAIFTSPEKGFEMGENRRYKQRVFLFFEKPPETVIARLKESGFTYRAAEKAWTITATAETRKLSEDLAGEFSGRKVGMSR